jgi:hypothetical protein
LLLELYASSGARLALSSMWILIWLGVFPGVLKNAPNE